MKRKGDVKNARPLSLGQIIQEGSKSITIHDDRYNRFYNYKPLPALTIDGGFWKEKKRRVKAIVGGNQSGKTFTGVHEAVMVYTGIIPKALQGIYPHTLPKRARHVRIIVQDYSKHWSENIRPLLVGIDYGILPEAWSDWSEQEHMFTGPDGSFLSIVAIDPTEKTDPNILRGPKIDHTMIDEISTEVCLGESLARVTALKDGPKTVTLTYCPQNGYSCWTYDRLYAACYDKLTKKRLPPERQHKEVFSQVITMRDNPSVSEETIQSLIASFRDWEVPYRVWGEYSQRASNPYFNMEMLLEWEKKGLTYNGAQCRLVEDKVDTETGKFASHIELATSQDKRDGVTWDIWDEPKQGRKYLCSVDCAEGNADGDFSIADIWDFTDVENVTQCAQLRTRSIKAGAFAIQAACMATLYNALLVPESLGAAGGIVVDRVRNYQYIYKRMSVGKTTEEETERLGFHTGPTNKGTMLEDLYKMLQRHHGSGKCPIRSGQTLFELLGYEEQIIRNKYGVSQVQWNARLGSHDDTVMSAAIAARVGKHEHYKIPTCVLSRSFAQSGLTKMEKEAQMASTSTGGAYGQMKKKPSLEELRRKYARPQDGNRRSLHGYR